MVLIHHQLHIINQEHPQIQFIHLLILLSKGLMLFEHTLEHMYLVKISLDQQVYRIQDLQHQCLLQQQLILRTQIQGQQVIHLQIQLEESLAPE